MRRSHLGILLFTCGLGVIVAAGSGCREGAQQSAPSEAPAPVPLTEAIQRSSDAPPHGPRIEVKQPEYDGDVMGLTVRHGFVVRNSGDQELKITDVEASCGCTTTSLERRELAPGEAVEINAVRDVSEGRLESRLYVYTNDEAHSITPLLIRAKHRPAGLSTLAFLPAVVHVVVKPGEEASAEVLLKLTTFGATSALDGAIVPTFEKSAEGIKLELVPMHGLKAGDVAQFGQVKGTPIGPGVAFAQVGMSTLLWAVRYKVRAGDEVGVFRKLAVARVPSAVPEAAAAIGFVIEVNSADLSRGSP